MNREPEDIVIPIRELGVPPGFFIVVRRNNINQYSAHPLKEISQQIKRLEKNLERRINSNLVFDIRAAYIRAHINYLKEELVKIRHLVG